MFFILTAFLVPFLILLALPFQLLLNLFGIDLSPIADLMLSIESFFQGNWALEYLLEQEWFVQLAEQLYQYFT